MKQTDPQFKVRLPSDVKAFIEAEAERCGSSMNAEIVRCIRNKMDAEGTQAARLRRLEYWAWGDTVPDRLPPIETFAAG